MVSELIAGTVDRKILNKWKETKKSFVYKPKGRAFYYIDGKRFRLSQLKLKQAKSFGVTEKKYLGAVYISKIKKIYFKEKKIYFKEKKITKKKRVRKKEKPEQKQQMYRLTLAINYAVRNQYYSVKTQMWSVIWLKLKDNEERLKDELIKRLKNKLGWEKDWVDWFSFEPNTAVDEVDYRPNLEGRVEETDEFLKLESHKRQNENLLKAKGLDSPDWF